MMIKKFWLACCLVLLFCIPAQNLVSADGIIIPDPPPCWPTGCPRPIMEQLTVKYHHVEVTIDNQVAVTRVDQVFFNPNDYPVEGTYTFPLPAGAVVTNFKLWIDGEPVQGKVLDASSARAEYEAIVRSLRDPALLEYVDRGAVMARIFPIDPNAERRIELEYSQVLTENMGTVEYRYPLNTEKFSAEPIGSVVVNVTILSTKPVNGVYSPSHTLSTDMGDPYLVNASYEASNVKPDTDFVLYYSTGSEEGVHVLSYHDPQDIADPDGFFIMLLTPPEPSQEKIVPKDIVLVLDHSGSMEGEKFRQVQAAARFILEHLQADDHFNMVAFSSEVTTFAETMQMDTEYSRAVQWIDKISPGGATDIDSALRKAIQLTNNERPTYLIFLTDGLPTHGEVNSQRILENVKGEISKNIRLFSFGVGYDVDTVLLDTLAYDHHGKSAYVSPAASVDEVVTGFYKQISTPALTDLKLEVEGVNVYDMQPATLPDLFYGSQIVITGRYRTGGTTNIQLSARSDSGLYQRTFEEIVFTRGVDSDSKDRSYIARLWAARKVGALLTQIRLNGPDPETIQQIIQISIRYGIVTPYTSYLVTEPDALSLEGRSRIAAQEFNTLIAQPTMVSGAGAVNKAADTGAMTQAESVPAPSSSSTELVKAAGSRSFVLRDGIWTDTQFDPQKMTTREVKYLSSEYFKLAFSSPDIAAGLALGERVILVVGTDVIEIVE